MQAQDIDLLRFAVIGSVDDGKSTLTGRLLYETDSIYIDQVESLERIKEKRGDTEIDLALITDGLKAEREQGITIDVAYRYFRTNKRRFIIADCPGHKQYTRNMITGLSNCNMGVILVDATKGLVEQTKRHLLITSLLQVKHLILCINKMDLVDYSEERFEEIKDDFKEFSTRLNIPDIQIIPLSSIDNENIVETPKKMPWYKGTSLLYLLENTQLGSEHNFIEARFPIQKVIRPNDRKSPHRGYAGKIEGGVFKVGDEVLLLPSMQETKIEKIFEASEECEKAHPPMSVQMILNDDVDLSRGDMMVKKNRPPRMDKELGAMLFWMDREKLKPKGKYLLRHTSNSIRSIIDEVQYRVDINTLHKNEQDLEISQNDIAQVRIKLSRPIFWDKFNENKCTGSFILIDEFSKNTVAAGIIH